ncbi:MAG TPA: cation:proton antiporter [Burkholderiales bacterium]|nr:cation:proton antiporter [Burkholderiales bacterium]
MPELAFLPKWPPLANQMFWIGALLAAGVACGEAVRRFLRLPRITGYAAAGLALGPGGLGLIEDSVLEDLGVFADVAIGLVLFELGQRLDLAWLRRTPALALMGVAESLGAAGLVFFTLHYHFDLAPLPAGVAAAIAVATSPAVLMRVAAELRAEGQVTERALIVTAINGVLAFLALTVLIPWLHLEYRGGWLTMIVHPLYLLGGSAVLAVAAGWLTLRLARLIGTSPERQFIAVIAMVVLTVGVALALKLSVLLALLGMGALVRNADREHHLVVVDSGNAGQLFYVCLFVITGASLDLALLATAGAAGLAFVLVRFAGKAVGVLALAPVVGLGWRKGVLLATALAPMSGLAVVLVHQTAALYPEIRASVAPVVLAGVVILELAGPIATQFALRRAGETAEGTA